MFITSSGSAFLLRSPQRLYSHFRHQNSGFGTKYRPPHHSEVLICCSNVYRMQKFLSGFIHIDCRSQPTFFTLTVVALFRVFLPTHIFAALLLLPLTPKKVFSSSKCKYVNSKLCNTRCPVFFAGTKHGLVPDRRSPPHSGRRRLRRTG